MKAKENFVTIREKKSVQRDVQIWTKLQSFRKDFHQN